MFVPGDFCDVNVYILRSMDHSIGAITRLKVAMLRAAGVPFEAALSGTLLFRGFTLWVPLVPGMFAARRQLKRKKKD